MSDKSLAYVVEIKDLEPIKDKDRIELASFVNSNWKVIVQKGEYKIGDKAIYVETDGILPMWSEFQFLEKRCYSPKRWGYRIKTMKMGDVYSEGICFPMKILSAPQGLRTEKIIATHKWLKGEIELDYDLTEALEIRRVEDEVPQVPIITKSKFQNFVNKWLYKIFKFKFKRYGFVTQDFPSYLIKTDETQMQSIPNVFNIMKGKPVYVSLKMDGQSITYANYKGIFTISTRNRTIYQNKINKAMKVLNSLNAEWLRNHNVYAMMAAKLDIPRILNSFKNYAIQGEFCGPSIQKNRLGLNDFEFYVFNIYDIDEKKYFGYQKFVNYCETISIKTVPILKLSTFEWNSIKELEEYTSKFIYDNGNPAEGIVIRSSTGEYMEQPHRKMHAMCSMKMINPKFKLKYQQED